MDVNRAHVCRSGSTARLIVMGLGITLVSTACQSAHKPQELPQPPPAPVIAAPESPPAPPPMPPIDVALEPQFDLNALPPASAQYLIPSRLLGLDTGVSLQRVADQLVLALRRADYGERVAFYWLGGDGFVAITRFEQISGDGSPTTVPQRWSSEALRPAFGQPGWFKALFFPPGSRYRFIVFAVTPSLVRPSREQMSFARFAAAASGGAVGTLPWLDQVHTSGGTRAYALIYEFFRPTQFDTQTYVTTSPINSVDHLARTRLWSRAELELQ